MDTKNKQPASAGRMPALVGLLQEFVDMSEPEECGCEFQHVEWCNTMKWKRKLEDIRESSALADRIIDAVVNLRDVKGRHNTQIAYKRMMDLLPNANCPSVDANGKKA